MKDIDEVYIKVFNSTNGEILSLPIEEVVKMMVPTQISFDLHLEVLKTQAIVARTLLIKKLKMFGGRGCARAEGCDICNDEDHCFNLINEGQLRDQWKDSYSKNLEKLTKIVEETEGLIITFNNKPINAKFHDTCGGSTENSENVMGNEVAYLRKVLCDHCIESPNWSGYKEFNLSDIEKKLNVKFPKLTPSLRSDIKDFFEEVERDDQGRVLKLKIGGKYFKGTEVMESLGLNSTKFSFLPVVVGFNTQGKGHGLGLCQYGGNQMAVDGYSYNEIIDYYFTGVKIKKIEKPCINKPLCGRILIIDAGHGGKNSQDSTGPSGLKEKDVTLQIAIGLAEALEKLGAQVHLTREKDEYISLSKRAELGNSIRPNFFISIHLNSFPNPSIHGCEIYHYRNDKDSEALGKSIMNSLVSNLDILDRGVKLADFFLLREVGVSTIQLELEYISNPEQEKKLKNEDYVNRIISCIAQGILDYYKY